MSWVAVAGAIGAGASLYGASKAGKASDKAAKAAEEQAEKDRALNIERYGEAQELLSPYIQRADIGQQQLMHQLGLPVPRYSPYMEEQMALEQEAATEEEIAAILKERGISETMWTGGPPSRLDMRGMSRGSSPGMSTASRSLRGKEVDNPGYETAYQNLMTQSTESGKSPQQLQAEANIEKTLAAEGITRYLQ